MRIVTGDNTGLSKVVDVEKGSILSSFGQQERYNEIEFLEFFGTEQLVLSGNKKGELQLNEINSEGNFERLITVVGNDKNLVGLNSIGSQRIVLTYENNMTEVATYDEELEEFSEFSQVYCAGQSNIQRVKLNKNDKKQLLVLAKDINPQVYDLEVQKLVWKARNVKNDWLDLKVPIHDVDGAFFHDSSCIYTINAAKKMRIYDLRQNNSQPTKDIQQELSFDKTAFKRMELSSCGNYIFAASAAGNLFKFDTRKDFRMTLNFKGSSGSVKDVKVHPTLPYVASVSLDRYLRVYHQDTKELVNKVYLKQRLHSLLFGSEGLTAEEEVEEPIKERIRKPAIPSLEEDEDFVEQVKSGRVDYRKRSIAAISNSKTYQALVEHKNKFQDIKKHSIKLSYLEKKFEADKEARKNKKTSSKVFVQAEEQEVEEEVEKRQHLNENLED